MNISVELSLYPLSEEYGTPILKFIERLKSYKEIMVTSNTMSTQVFGSYDLVMDVLKKEMEPTFIEEKTVVMIAKFANLDLRP